MPSNAEDWENQGAGTSPQKSKSNNGTKKTMRLSEAQDQLSAWTRVIDQWGEITYVNTITKMAKRLLPDAICLAGRDAVVALRTINVSRDAYRVEKPDPDDELYNSGVGVYDDPEMIARVAATKKYRRDMEKRRLELKEDGKREWEVLADPETGEAYYWNHITHQRRPDMPSSLDHFGDLQRLESLVINAGDLQALPLSLFSKRHPIKKIEIQGNMLRSIPSGIWRCIALQSLRIPGNQLIQLPETLGRVMTLTELDVTGNKLVYLPRSLGDCVILKKLFISHNRLRDIPPTLCRCRKLESLVLSHNPFTKCDDIISMVEMGSKIGEGIKYFLKHCRERRAREIRGAPPNGKLVVHHGINDSCSQLDIRQRQGLMTAISVSLSTRKLYWFWNGLPGLNNTILGCDHLIDLRLVGNKIEYIPDGLSVLKSLQIFIAHSNQIATIGDKAFRGVQGSLKVLDLSMNKILKLPPKIVRLRKLAQLRLKCNCLTELPDDFGKLRRLIVIDLGMNQLNKLPSNISGLELLESLDLQRNQLTNSCIDLKFERLISLTSLNLTMNNFTIIPKHIGQLKKLQELKFAANLIEMIPDSLSSGPLQKNLTKLWLPNNKLSRIPLSFARLKALQSIMVC